jgi:protein pelota
MLDKCVLFSPLPLHLLNFFSRFFKMLGTDEQRAWYGPTHVSLAANRGAVGTLLISDELFRASNPAQRKIYVELVETVKGSGAEVLIFSSMHESGQRE